MASSNEELEARLQALYRLLESPGWAYFTQVVQQTTYVSKEAGRKAETPHQMGFHFGSAYTAEQLLTWPQREMVSLKATLEQT